ncbi:MAG: response regulator [Candidatus Omnitrophica bacterium]|nr:response regulator [Candidatus Omnitrophota bacterium]
MNRRYRMSKVILAIDDDTDFLSVLDDILSDEGYRVITLSEPRRTEEYVEKHRPDLMIIDIFMPDRTGFHMIEEFRDKGLYSDLPKIFLTCLDDDIERMTARACGINAYITKPFQPEELIEKVSDLLKERARKE